MAWPGGILICPWQDDGVIVAKGLLGTRITQTCNPFRFGTIGSSQYIRGSRETEIVANCFGDVRFIEGKRSRSILLEDASVQELLDEVNARLLDREEKMRSKA